MPQRPRRHILANESRVAFEHALPSDWVARRVDGSDDYGIDYEIEVFESGRTTGVTFKVQLKGTDDEREGARPIRVEFETLDYWNGLDVPVMLAHYSAPTGDVRYRWMQAHDPFYDRQAGRSAASVDVRGAAALAPDIRERLLAEVSFARALKRGERMPLPIPIKLTIASAAASRAGLARNALVRLIETDLRGVVVFASEGSTAFEITAADDRLAVAGPAGLHTLTIEIPPEIRREVVPDVVAADCLAALGVLLCHAKNNDLGRRLLLSSARRSAIVVHPYVAQTAAECVIATASPGLALDICDRMTSIVEVLPFDAFDVSFQILMSSFMAVQSFASRTEYDRWIGLWAQSGDLHRERGDDDGAARCAYNQAKGLTGKREYEAALRLLQGQQLIFDGYPDRAYFHRDVAELCWELQRRWQAVLAYRHAVAIDERNTGRSGARVLLADAMVRLGHLDEADATLAGWTTDDSEHLNRLAETLRSVIDAVRKYVPTPVPEPDDRAADRGEVDTESMSTDQVASELGEAGRFLDIALWERLQSLDPSDVGPAAVLAWLAHNSGHRWAWLAVLLHVTGAPSAQIVAAIDSGLELDPGRFLDTIDVLAVHDSDAHTEIAAIVAARSEIPDPNATGPVFRFNGRAI